MNYLEFKHRTQNQPLIYSRDLLRFEKNPQILRNQLTRWLRKGLICRLRKGLYILNRDDRKINLSRSFLANQLYTPSYLSLEYALNFYGMIPERVQNMTSITTKKTMRFKNIEGSFTYQHIKTSAFRGFSIIRDKSGYSYQMASPEKSLVDFLYFHLAEIKTYEMDIFEKSYRFQNLDQLNLKTISALAKYFSSIKLMRVIECFCAYLGSGD
jgi:hypothetical protein